MQHPKLVVLDCEGRVCTYHGEEKLRFADDAKKFPWGLTGGERLGEDPARNFGVTGPISCAQTKLDVAPGAAKCRSAIREA